MPYIYSKESLQKTLQNYIYKIMIIENFYYIKFKIFMLFCIEILLSKFNVYKLYKFKRNLLLITHKTIFFEFLKFLFYTCVYLFNRYNKQKYIYIYINI